MNKLWRISLWVICLLMLAAGQQLGAPALIVSASSGPVNITGSPVNFTGGPVVQDGGGIHFGAYTLAPGNLVKGNLIVFGGPVSLGAASELDGDLTVFGSLTMASDAVISGQMVVMGSAEVDGRVEGDVFAAGTLDLGPAAIIEGDVATSGALTQDPAAVIEGEVTSIDEGDWNLPIPAPGVFPGSGERREEVSGISRWMTAIWRLIRGLMGVVLMSMLALIIASLWPVQLERIGRAAEEAPLVSFGIGLLALILCSLAAVLLAITICLSPFAFVGMVVVGIGVLLGWTALGLILGQRVLSGLFNVGSPKLATATIVGTALATLILAMSRVFGLLHTLLVFLLIPPAVGAVVLTRFGSMPYATRGTGGGPPHTPSSPTSGSSSGGVAPQPPAPRPSEPLHDVEASERAPVLSGPGASGDEETSFDAGEFDGEAYVDEGFDAPEGVEVEDAVLVGV